MKKKTIKPKKKFERYTQYYIAETQGGRIGLCICLDCGSAILLDVDRATEIHDDWHNSLRS